MEIMVNHFIFLKIILYSWLFLCLYVLKTYLKMSLIVHPELAFYCGHYAVALYVGIIWWHYVVALCGGIMRWDYVVAFVGVFPFRNFMWTFKCSILLCKLSWDAEIVCWHYIPAFNDSILGSYIILGSYTGF